MISTFNRLKPSSEFQVVTCVNLQVICIQVIQKLTFISYEIDEFIIIIYFMKSFLENLFDICCYKANICQRIVKNNKIYTHGVYDNN